MDSQCLKGRNLKMTLVHLPIVPTCRAPISSRRWMLAFAAARKLLPAISRAVLGCGVLGWLAGIGTPALAATPLAATQPATLMTGTGATLNGMTVPSGEAGVAWFEWGARGGYDRATSPVAVGAGTQVVRVSTAISGLTNGGIYQFRLVVSNATGVARGAAQLLTTGRRITIWGSLYSSVSPVPAGLTNVVAVTAGLWTSMALKTDGTVALWDYSSYEYWVPPELSNVVALASSGQDYLALKADGTVFAWGLNNYGQTNVPAGLSNVVAVAAGYRHDLALKSNGTITAWGANDHWQKNIPAGLSNVVAVAAGEYHSLALKADGTVTAWGDGSYGQTNVPADLSNVVAVASGQLHNLALKADGTVTAWGPSDFGKTNVPAGLSNVLAVAAGANHSMALKADGTVVVWGSNNEGQTNAPAGLSNVAAITCGELHNLVIANLPPQTASQLLYGSANQDLIIQLTGSDPNGDGMSFRIDSLPAQGALYQYTDSGRGPAIVSADTLVSDPGRRLIFAPVADSFGNPYASFSVVINDGECDSTPATITTIIGWPQACTQPVAPVAATNGTLNGMVVPNGLASVAWFEWGARGSYSQTTSPVDVGAGAAVVRLTTEISGLICGRSYQCRLVVSNAASVVYGAPQLFTTGRKVLAWGKNDYYQTSVPSSSSNSVAIAGGWWHSLALKNDGTVAAWYLNYQGQSSVPEGLSNVVAVAASDYHSMALQTDGTVVIWGNSTNVYSDLGDVIAIAAGINDRNLALRADGTVVAWGLVTNVPVGLSNVVAISVGGSYDLALKADGTVAVWGAWTNLPTGLTNIVSVAAGYSHSLALKNNGTVMAWGGDNSFGETDVPAGLSNAVAVAAGLHQSLALCADGTLVAWGRDNYGQGSVPASVSNVVAIACGGDHNLVIRGDLPPQATSQIVSGPANQDLVIQLGGSDPDGDSLNFRVGTLPAQGALFQYTNGVRGLAIVSPGTPVSDVGRRVIFAPAIDGFGNPYDNFSFLANDGELDSATATVTILIAGSQAFTRPATQITAGNATLNGMALPNGLASMAWFEWGARGGYGQTTGPVDVGNSTTVVSVNIGISGLTNGGVYQCRLVISNVAGVVYGAPQWFTTGRKITVWGRYGPEPIPVLPGLSNVVAVAGGLWQSLALKNDGTVAVVCGEKQPSQTNLPPGLTNVVAISAGNAHSLALQSNGTIVAWGNSASGVTNVPAGLSNVVAVAAGSWHSLALKANGTVVSWGDNNYNQTNVPAGLSNVVAVASGFFHSLALRANGTIAAWGRNTEGQGLAPVGLSNVVAIAAGGYHNLALRTDGTVMAWGNYSSGQTNVPAGLADVMAVAAGGAHSLTLKSDGTVVAWGSNANGQTNAPAGLSNVVAIAGGSSHSLAIGPNLPPLAQALTNSGYPNHDSVIQLRGSDLNGDGLNFRVAALPTAGGLYQYDAGARGVAISASGSSVSDALGRVLFAPAPDALGSPYATFGCVANDGEADSAPATVTVNVILPPAPQLSLAGSGWSSNGNFRLSFSGNSNATYRVWASTNLIGWDVLGTATMASNGWFQWLDTAASNWPRRFYRAGAP
jgi:alpha-tubulin suppressor-like RCC1 family protein